MIFVSEVVYGEEKPYKAEHDAAYRLLGRAVREVYGISAGEGDISRTEYGKPYFTEYPQIHFSLSHCRGLAVCLLSGHECGVDAEVLRSPRGAEKRVFSAAELDILRSAPAHRRDIVFTSIWTLKEAYSKAEGRGIASMKNVSFSWENGRLISDDPEHSYYLRRLGGYIIAVCLRKGEPLEGSVGEDICPLTTATAFTLRGRKGYQGEQKGQERL